MNSIGIVLGFFLCAITVVRALSQGSVIVNGYDEYRLTHVLVPVGPIPTAVDPNGVYPYVSYSETSNRPVLKKFRFQIGRAHV